jgi:hypothetical protein
MTELERIKNTCHSVHMEKFRFGIIQFQTALNYIHRSDFVTAKRFFPTVEEDLKLAFTMVTTYTEKILVTRLRILTALFIHHYFYLDSDETECNHELLQANCQDIFDTLTKLPLVVKTFKDDLTIVSFNNIVCCSPLIVFVLLYYIILK